MRRPRRSMTILLMALALLAIPRQAPADRGVDPTASRSIERRPSDSSAGTVTLPLDDYLRLVEPIELAGQARQAPAEAAIAVLTAQTTELTLDGSTARIQATYHVQLTGRPSRPVGLPVTGLVKSATLKPPAREGANGRGAALHRQSGGLLLVAPEPGSYTVEVASVAELEDDGGVSRLKLAESRAGLATLALDLPAGVSWTCERAVVVEESSGGERRRLLLAPERGERAVLELRRAAAAGAAETTRARAVVVTMARLGGDRFERHDVVHYEVSRGELDRFEVDLPNGLEVTRATTDEGSALPILDARRLAVERAQRLASTGHLTLAFPAWRLPAADAARPPLATEVPLPPVEPAVPVRSRYLVLASDRGAEIEPLPAESWDRVDFEDLPNGVRSRVAALEAGAVWRRTEAPSSPRLRVALHSPVETLAAVVRQRSTTTLLTVDGALVHRDRLLLDRAGAAFELTLPAAARLWSAKVDGQAVRPIKRGGALAIPLAFKAEGATEIEVVSIEERRVDRGVSRLGIDAPRVQAPVIEHQWRLLLPEQQRYRLAESALRPAPAGETNPDATARVGSKVAISYAAAGAGQAGIAGRVVDEAGEALPGVTVSVTGAATRIATADGDGRFAIVQLPPGTYRIAAQLDGFSSVETVASVPEGRTAEVELTLPLADVSEEIVVTASMAVTYGSTPDAGDQLETAQRRRAARREIAGLRQGLLGGVKPLAVELPESGKLLLLAGALPPPEVGVELEVRVR